MFLLNGNPISPDAAFRTPDGTQYPANWIRLSTPEQREAIGITEAPDSPVHDQRYYWGYDADGNLIPKQLEDKTITPEEGEPYTQTGLKTQHIQQNKQTANTLLAPTDWYIIRKFERNIDIPENIATYRAAVITVADERETLISAVRTVAELKELYEVSVMPNWPSMDK
jgi:hypothetical protein